MSKPSGLVSSFVDLIKELRDQKGLTIEQLADLAGVHRTTIGLLERNERLPSLQLASQLAAALEMPLSELILEAEFVEKGQAKAGELVKFHLIRSPLVKHIRNEEKLVETLGIDGSTLLGALNFCYQTLDTIDEQLTSKGAVPIGELVELANLSSMVGNLIGAGIADSSHGLYKRNRPHTYPDLLPIQPPAVDLELKVALESNKPKGHLPKAGTYITIRYVLCDQYGAYSRGKENRGNTVWIWEVKVGSVREEDFSISNTDGDSGKTAVIKTAVHNNMHLVYYVPEHLPYARRVDDTYVGFN